MEDDMKHRTVESVMTPLDDVVCARPHTSYKEIVRLLTEHRVSALPVLGDAGRILGVVSEGDLLVKEGQSHQAPPLRRPLTSGESAKRRKVAAQTAAELMTAPPITIQFDEHVAAAARRLEGHRIKRMPVLDAAGHLAGIVSGGDLLRVFLRSDVEILAEVNVLLVHDFWLSPEGWTATVDDGVVVLCGEMEARSSTRIAEAGIRRIDGVVSVTNALRYAVDDEAAIPARDRFAEAVLLAGHRRDGGR
jgi:CBS-domain-containing membrane protein